MVIRIKARVSKTVLRNELVSKYVLLSHKESGTVNKTTDRHGASTSL